MPLHFKDDFIAYAVGAALDKYDAVLNDTGTALTWEIANVPEFASNALQATINGAKEGTLFPKASELDAILDGSATAYIVHLGSDNNEQPGITYRESGYARLNAWAGVENHSLKMCHTGGGVTDFPCDFVKGHIYKLVVTAAGGTITAKVYDETAGGSLLVEGSIPDAGDAGRWGVRAVGDAGAQSAYSSFEAQDAAYVPLDGEFVPSVDAPARVRLSEKINGVFVDATLETDFFPVVDLPLGEPYQIGDELAPDNALYKYRVTDRSESGGLISYRGETLLSELNRIRPLNSLVLVPGQKAPDGSIVPDPLTPGYCLRVFLNYYGILFSEPLPEFYLRTTSGAEVPQLDAFVVQPDEDDPESLYEWLEQIFAPFSGYVFRANEQNRLAVYPPYWLEQLGITTYLYREFKVVLGSVVSSKNSDSLPYPWTSRRPVVTLDRLVGAGGSASTTLEADTPQVVTLGDQDLTLEWATASGEVTVSTTPALHEIYRIRVGVRPEDVDGADFLTITNADLAPDGEESTSADSVTNQAEITVRGMEFQEGQQIMEPSAVIIRSPKIGLEDFFNNVIGPPPRPSSSYDDGAGGTASDVDSGYAVIAEKETFYHTAFWPVADNIVFQPGTPVELTLEIDEWVTEYDHFLFEKTPVLDLTHVEDFTLPTDGERYEVANLTYDFGSGITTIHAAGKVYARWRGGSRPGVEITVDVFPHSSAWYLQGQRHYLWGVVIQLNGTGTVFTRSDDQFTARFGYNQVEDAWENGVQLSGLAQSQELYQIRERKITAGIYSISEELAFRIVRSIVENEYRPTTLYRYTTVPKGDPAFSGGYRLKPWHSGRRVRLPNGSYGFVRSWDYLESHVGGSKSAVSIEVEVPAGSAVTRSTRYYGKAGYRVNKYVRAVPA